MSTAVDQPTQIKRGPFLDIRSFGAKCDGTTDDTAAVQSAVDAAIAAGGGRVFFPATSTGTKIATGVTIDGDNVELAGVGAASFIKPTATSGTVFNFTGASTTRGGCGIRDLRIQGDLYYTRTAIGVNNQNSFRADGVSILQTNTGIQISGASFLVWVQNCSISYLAPTVGVGVSLVDGSDVYLTSNEITSVIGSEAAAGINIKNTNGAVLRGNGILNVYNGLLVNPASGKEAKWVSCTGNMYDTCSGNGISIEPTSGGTVHGFRSVQDWASTNAGYGVNLSPVGTTDGVEILQGFALNNALSGYNIYGGTNIRLTDCVAAGNSRGSSGTHYGALVAANVTHCAIRGGTYGPYAEFADTQGWGIAIAGGGTDDYITVDGANVIGNTAGRIYNASTGAHNVVRDCPGYNPVGAASVTVTASPFTHTTGATPEVLYVQNTSGTVSDIKCAGTTVAATAVETVTVYAPANTAVVVTYSGAAPTMVKHVQ